MQNIMRKPTFFEGMTTNDVVIVKDLSVFGLLRLHVVNVLGPVDREYWINLVEDEAGQRGRRVDWDHAGICAFSDFQEVHHLWIVWKEVTDEC